MASQAEDFKNKGNAAYTAGRHLEAVNWYTQAIQIDPKNQVYYSNRSAAYLGALQNDKALEDAQKCVDLKADWSKGYFLLGSALVALSRFAEAVPAFKKSLDLDPTNADLKKKLQEADELKKKYQPRTNPDGSTMTAAQIAKNEGNDLFRASKYEAAIEAYARALSMKPDASDRTTILSNRAACYMQFHSYENVIRDCTEAVQIQPQNTKALIRRALACEGLEKWQKALDDFRAVLAIDPSASVAQQGANRVQNLLRKI